MAILEDIRKRGGIIVSVVIGIALLAFVLSDFVPGGRGGVRNLDVAEVGGETLSVQTLEARIEQSINSYQQMMMQQTGQSDLSDQMRDMLHEQAWGTLIDETVMVQEFQLVGLAVVNEEATEIVTGQNPHPYIRQIPAFINPQTGEFDRSLLNDFLRTKDSNPNDVAEWKNLMRRITYERYQQKFRELLSKGIFVPNFMVENENQETNRKIDFDYVVQKYISIPDSAITLTDDERRAFYKKNTQQWEQTTSRDIEYAVFNILPSDDDRTAAHTWIEKTKLEFEAAADPLQYAKLNTKIPANTRFMTREQLPVQVVDLFDSPVGTMSPFYQEGEILKLVRLANVENRPDSVNVRQIFLVPKAQTQPAYQATVTLADSIKTAIVNGSDFGTLAVKYSADPNVTTTRGETGWMKESAIPAGSLMENIFSMKKGDVQTLDSGQGFLIVQQVTERGREIKKVQIATIQYNIVPSTRTVQNVFSQASKFAADSRTEQLFDQTAMAQNLTKRLATYLNENDRQIPGLTSAREIVRWAYEARRGTVSDVFSVEGAYVVAVLKTIRKKGTAPIQQVLPEIDLAIRREKKAAQISAQLAEAVKHTESFSDLATSLNLLVESASDITFSSFSIPDAGIEPELIATAASIGEGSISQPVEGANGIYLLMVKQTSDHEETAKEQVREHLDATYANRTMSEPLQALRKAAYVKDMRSKFY